MLIIFLKLCFDSRIIFKTDVIIKLKLKTIKGRLALLILNTYFAFLIEQIYQNDVYIHLYNNIIIGIGYRSGHRLKVCGSQIIF